MATRFNSISEISPMKENWTILAKVVRLWLVSDFNKDKIPFSMEMVLMDAKGDIIHASVRRTLIYKFQKLILEGVVYSFQYFGVAANGGSYRTCRHSYKLNFQFSTKVALMDNDSVPGNIYDFVPISQIIGGGFDTDFLVDVMGLLTGVGTEREYDRNGKKTKINVICVEADGYKIECTLFGPYVDELNTFLASGEVQNAVVLIQFGKVKCFQDKIHLQNCMNCTKLFFNPDFDEAVKLRKRLTESMESPTQALSQLIDSTKVSMSEDFLELTPRKTILALKDVEKGSSYVVLATVIHILEDDDWWYTACICSKGVIVDSKMFFCGKCNKHVMKVEPRYCIKVRVMDETDSTTFVIFDRDATALFNKSCVEMFEIHDKSSAPGSLPKEISNLVGKTFLFKVECNSKFPQSFGVKKICNDLSVINKFKDLSMKSVDVNSGSCDVGGRKEIVINGSSIDLAQDLMTKFSSAFVENESQCDDKEGFDISKDSEDLTPLKRDYAIDLDQSDLELPLKMLKKNIKTEKD